MAKRYAALLLIITAVLTAGCSGRTAKQGDTIVVGSKNFTEQLIVGNMAADLIEANTNLNVDRKLNLGGTVAFDALKNGGAKDGIDVYVEYTGTGLVAILDEQPTADPGEAYDKVKKGFAEKYGLAWLQPWGFNNTWAIAVKRDFAQKNDLHTITDLAGISQGLVFGCSVEFPEREDGLPGLEKTYGLKFKNVNAMDPGLRYKAIDSGASQAMDAYTTDGLLVSHKLAVLEDDKHFFPPYYAAPIIREDVLKKHPELEGVLDKLAGKIDDKTMQQLNYQVDEEGKDPADVSREFLKSRGLI